SFRLRSMLARTWAWAVVATSRFAASGSPDLFADAMTDGDCSYPDATWGTLNALTIKVYGFEQLSTLSGSPSFHFHSAGSGGVSARPLGRLGLRTHMAVG